MDNIEYEKIYSNYKYYLYDIIDLSNVNKIKINKKCYFKIK